MKRLVPMSTVCLLVSLPALAQTPAPAPLPALEQSFELLKTYKPADDPTALIANGGLRWAFFLREEDWEIPLFVLGERSA